VYDTSFRTANCYEIMLTVPQFSQTNVLPGDVPKKLRAEVRLFTSVASGFSQHREATVSTPPPAASPKLKSEKNFMNGFFVVMLVGFSICSKLLTNYNKSILVYKLYLCFVYSC